jgi:hypothetical protein
MNVKKGYVYLLIEREFIRIKENTYKIGKTEQGLNRIFKYPKNSELIMIIESENCHLDEKLIIKLFKEKFIHKKEYGNEYFWGDKNLMKQIIFDVVKQSELSLSLNYNEYHVEIENDLKILSLPKFTIKNNESYKYDSFIKYHTARNPNILLDIFDVFILDKTILNKFKAFCYSLFVKNNSSDIVIFNCTYCNVIYYGFSEWIKKACDNLNISYKDYNDLKLKNNVRLIILHDTQIEEISEYKQQGIFHFIILKAHEKFYNNIGFEINKNILGNLIKDEDKDEPFINDILEDPKYLFWDMIEYICQS